MKKLYIFCFLISPLLSISQEINVIDNKGTIKTIDNSKWQLSGTNIYNKNTGNVGIGTSNPQSLLHTDGTLRFENLATNTTNNFILTTDASGNITIRTIANLLENNAITSLNGLTNSIQTFSIGNAGIDFNINSSGTIHTFNIPTASATNRGLLSSTDWEVFNNKIGIVTANTPMAVSTSGTNATINNSTAYWNAYQLQGRNIALTAPSDGQVLTWDNIASVWKPSTTISSIDWSLTGNSGTTAGTNFVGTTDNIDLVFKINNTESGRLNIFNEATSFGMNSISAYRSTNIGYNAGEATITEGVSIGNAAKAKFQSVAIGYFATNSSTSSIAIGKSATSAYQSVAIGTDASASNNQTTAIGYGAAATAINATAIGYNTTASNTNTVILGNNANVGIGLVNPSEKLDVTGNIKFSGSLKPNNLSGTSGQILQSTGSTTAPTWINTSSIAIAEDVTGTLGSSTVAKLQGRNIATTAPTEGQVLTWDATASTWKPAGYTVTTIAGTTYTLSGSDHGKILDFTSNSAITLTVPNTLASGFQVSITQAGTGQITIAGSGGMAVNNRWAGTKTIGRWAKAGIEVRATNSSILSGDVQ